MDEHLQSSKRFADDKILTKTMINNYTKKIICCLHPIKEIFQRTYDLIDLYLLL